MPLSTAYAWPLNELFVAEESASPRIQEATVYIDTSVVSYLTSRLNRSMFIARRQRLTRVWWHRYKHHHARRISVRVTEEAEDGDPVAARARLNALAGIEILPFDASSESLAEKLVGRGLLPDKAQSDAAHIAVAATNGIPLLLTWNCKHLANRIIHRAIVRACEVEGFRCPDICTPEHLMRIYSHARSNP
jgi:predicted nucleic acid-binding protein